MKASIVLLAVLAALVAVALAGDGMEAIVLNSSLPKIPFAFVAFADSLTRVSCGCNMHIR